MSKRTNKNTKSLTTTATNEPAEAQRSAPKGKSVISRDYKRAVKNRNKDWIAEELEQARLGSEDGLRQVAIENGLLDRWNNKWASKNVGMRQMNLGNVLRGMERRGEPVTILGISRSLPVPVEQGDEAQAA